MQPPPNCPRCGAPASAGSAACPRCLLELGVAVVVEAGDDAAPTTSPARMVPPSVEELRELFPDLEIEGLIGQGGMGAVYRAKQRRLDRGVALKVLPRELSADRAFADRFLREARALARLSHPNIVAVHDHGETGGICWLLLEYVDGANLREVLRAGDLEPRQALAIVRELCDALQYAHDEGVVHRDVKPENVLVDRRGRAKVADFGLAKLVGPAPDANLTREGQVMGTPHYMAPEQIERPRDVDHRADIYALGVVFYEMLTGSLPRGNFEPPSRRVQVDVRLDEIVLKALEREPSRRYQHAVDVKTDVDAVGDGARTEAAPAVAPEHDPAQMGVEGFGLHVELGRPGVHVRKLNWPRARGDAATAAASPEHGALLRGWRGFAVVLVAWVAIGASWNLGPFAFGLAAVIAILLGGLLVRGRLSAQPELAAALAAESLGRKQWRLVESAALGVLGLVVVALGHVAHWEQGVSSWVPAWRGTDGLLDNLRTNVWSLMPPPLAVDEIVQPRIALLQAATTRNTGEALPVPGLAIILIGIVVLGFAVHAAVRLRERAELRNASLAVASGLSAQMLSGLLVLWIGGPLAALRNPSRLDMVFREIRIDLGTRTDVPTDQVLGRFRIACLRSGLAVDVEQVAQVVDERTAEVYADLVLLRCASSSPFERWSTTWSGAVRRTPQIWVSDVRPRGSARVVRMNAGLYRPGSPEAREAAEMLASMDAWVSAAQ